IHLVQNGWPDKVALFVTFDLNTAAVEEDLSALVHARLDQRADARLGRGRNQRAQVSVRLLRVPGQLTCVDFELASLLHQLWDPLPRLPDKDGGRESHAPLPRRAKCSPDKGGQRALFVGVWHDNSVVLCPHVRLDALAVLGASLVDVLA
ncbi:hypothetical protein EGW08_006604, partial [Elysia chlorotica]